ncbi:MAG: sulfatase [Planctomycetales bacterium]|nr:sulfatase [Planctomycetales bacterium]
MWHKRVPQEAAISSMINVRLLAVIVSCSCVHTLNAAQPNIVVLIADDLGYGELGCQGNPQIPTPHIDRLAETGVRCTQAYVTAPNCSPSRAGFLTGRFPTRFGYEFNPIGARNEDPGTGIPQSETLLSEMLHNVGYTTALIGKWHLGGAPDFHPQRHGFDEFFGFTHEGHYFVPPPWTGATTMLRRKSLPAGTAGSRYRVSDSLIYSSHMGHDEPDYDANNPILRIGQPVVEEEYLTDAIAREACSFVDRFQSSPFFLCVTFNAVHSPLQAKKSTFAKFDSIEDVHRRIFAAMLSDLDTAVGRIVNKLDECKIREKTLVVFFSDNGGPTKELTSNNLPLRGGKGSMYEGGLRVPFIANWPSVLPRGRQCDDVISSMDILPTAARLASAEVPNSIDGRDILPVLRGDQTGLYQRTLYWRQGNRAALRDGNWKLVSSNRSNRGRKWELFDLQSDMVESHDFAAENPAKLQELVSKWTELDKQMMKPAF